MNMILISIAFTLLLPFTVSAAYIGYLCPAGAQQGTTCDFIAGGRDLPRIQGVIMDGAPHLEFITLESVQAVPGGLFHIQKTEQKKYIDQCIRAVFKGEPAPELPADTTGWNTKNPYLQNVEKLTDIQREMLVRGFYTRPDPLQSSPSIAQKSIIRLKIAANAPTGRHTLRFIGSDKRPLLCNPIPFFISEIPETREPFSLPPPDKPATPTITLPAILNGQILPGETDHYRFEARKGDTWSFRVYGRALLPFIGDGVPGHFQPILQILDSQGREAAFQDDTYFDPDPVLNFTVPSDDTYTLIIRDALFRGRDDFVYRIEVKAGSEAYRLLPGPDWKLPEVTLAEGQTSIQAPFPGVVHGTILPGKRHHIIVNLMKGMDAVFEIWARRSLSPLDSTLRVIGPDGRQLILNDDFPRPKIGPVYHHADSYLRLKAPASGIYTIEIADACNAGGKDYRYWLRLDIPRPDFRIWSVSSGVELPAGGGTTPLGLVVERLDGHTGDISLMLADADGIAIAGSRVIPFGDKKQNSFESVCGQQAPFPDCTKEYITLQVTQPSKAHMTSLKLLAQSDNLIHPVIPADESMQAFAYNHLIEAQDGRAIILWRNSDAFVWTETPNSLQPGQTIQLKATLPDPKVKLVEGSCTAELFAPPAGFSLVGCTTSQNEITLQLKADPSMPPCRFNQIIRLNYSREHIDKNGNVVKKEKASAYLPAILLNITPQAN